MNDVNELKQFVVVHARGQRLPRYDEVLSRIHTDEDGPGSWVREWSQAAAGYDSDGKFLDACRHYAMARFPYVNSPARQEALDRGIAAFERWRTDQGGVERLDLLGGQVRCWAAGLSPTRRRPLLLIMGGIVTVKEQWAPLLAQIDRLGMAGVVTEMPGVGENALRYGANSWQMLAGMLDELGDRADVRQTYAMTLSFSGHMALRCASVDDRIRGVITTGAPINDFFTDVAWQKQIPRITVNTLAHLAGTKAEEIPGGLRDWALADHQLGALRIPVCYVASRRDEIIPPGEVARLRSHVRDLRLLEHDDVHGSPRHTAETQLWSVLSLLRIREVHNLPRAIVSLRWRFQRAHQRLF